MDAMFEARTRRLQSALATREAAGVVLTASPNLYYLTGFWETQMDRHLLCFVGEDGDPAIVAPSLYATQLAETTWIDDVRTYGDDEDPIELVESAAKDRGLTDGLLLLDPTMWARFTQDLRDALPSVTFGLADDVMAELRIHKDEAERDAIRRASAVADEVVETLRRRGEDVLGTTEAELAADVETELAAAGGEELAFDVIAGSGPNGAKPHHHHSDREIRAGEPVVLDFGTRVDHYPSDQTRTLVFGGTPSDEFQSAFEAVRDAQEAAVRAVEPGVTAGHVDDVARSVIEERGYGEGFVHRTGHGVGLDVHEEPYIVAGNDRELEPGMVFSVEPGVYVASEYGVRIEDLVLVTDDGAERLNTTSRDYRPTTET